MVVKISSEHDVNRLGTKAKAVTIYTVVSDGIVSHHKFCKDNEIMIII